MTRAALLVLLLTLGLACVNAALRVADRRMCRWAELTHEPMEGE